MEISSQISRLMLILHRNQEALGTGAPCNKVTSSDWCCSDEEDQSTSVRSKRASDQFLLASVSALHNHVYHDTIHGFSLVLIYDLLEHRCIDDVIINNIFLLSSLNTIDSMLPRVCTIIDHRKCKNVLRTSVSHLTVPCEPLFSSSILQMITDR